MVESVSGSSSHSDQSQSPATEQVDASTSPPTADGGLPRQLNYEELFEQVKNRPCRVAHIEHVYEGKQDVKLRTRPHIIERELQRVYDAKTLEEIHLALEEAGRSLQQLQIFRKLDMLVTEEPKVL